MTKPRVDKKVPTYDIDRMLGRIHVATPDDEVVEKIQEAIAKARRGKNAAEWTTRIEKQSVAYALWRHHENRATYAAVMGQTHLDNEIWLRENMRRFGHGGI